MGTRTLLEAVRKRWRIVVAVTLIGVLAALAYAVFTPRSYRSTSSVFFSLQFGNTPQELVQGSTYTQNQVASYARLATTPRVLQAVIGDLNLKVRPADLATQVQASAPLDTVLVDITATASTPQGSASLADAVARELGTTVEQLAPRDIKGNPTVLATTVAAAEVPKSASAPKPVLDLAVGLAVGLLLGLALAWLRDALDTRVRDGGAVAQVTDLPVVGTISVLPGGSSGPNRGLAVETQPHSPQAEFFRQTAANLQFLDAGGEGGRQTRSVLVTSSLAGEGKTTVAANLAAALAEAGGRVVLVDADLRRPAIAELLGLEGAVGLSTALLGSAPVEDLTQEWGRSGLRVLPAGPVPPNPTELLNSPAMRRLLKDLRQRFDYVVLDAAPLLPVADAVILSRAVDGVLVVANAGKARRHHLAEGLENLDRVGARTLGVVLNAVKRKGSAYGYSGQATGEPSGRDAGQPAAEPGGVSATSPASSQTSATSAVPVGGRERAEDGERG